MKKRFLPLLLTVLAISQSATAQGAIVHYDFVGKAGSELLPNNTVGPLSAEGMPSNATGGESGSGIFFDTVTSILHFDFSFSGLTGGLRDNGIHFHVGSNVFPNGPIGFNLNGGSSVEVSDEVTLLTPTINEGETSGRIAGQIQFTDTLTLTVPNEPGIGTTDQNAIETLEAGKLYLNIHSSGYDAGELRASLVAVPEPSSTAGILAITSFALTFSRRRQS
ncbi:MAG: CHRD domain-containing protein [Planctomycetota bacterium]